VRLGKRLKEKWKNNLLGIQEGEQDDRPSEHISSSSSSSSSQRSLHVDAEDKSEKTRIYQNTSFFEWAGGQTRDEAERQRGGTECILHEADETRRLNSSGLAGTQHVQTAEHVVADTIHAGIVVHSLTESSSNSSHGYTRDSTPSRQFNDDHYYIGSSDYAEVVEEHVSGKYEDDLQYYEGKSKEMLEVETRIMSKEELLKQYYECVEETEVQQRRPKPIIMIKGVEDNGVGQRVTRGQESTLPQGDFSLPPTLPPTTNASHQYISNWIQTENLVPPSSPDSGVSNRSLSPTGPNQNTDGEQDRSDESVVVTVNHRMVKRNNSDSGQSVTSNSSSAYKHIADYLKIKQKAHQPNSSAEQKLPRKKEKSLKGIYGEDASSFGTRIDERRISSSDSSSGKADKASKQSRHNQQPSYNKDIGSSVASREEKNFSSSKPVSQGNWKEHQQIDIKKAQSVKQEQQPIRHELLHVSDSYKIVNTDKSHTGKKNTARKQKKDVENNIDINANNDRQDNAIINRQYRITQQEIIFYLKKADGLIKVVRRPLITSSQLNLEAKKEQAERKRKQSPMIRHLSQPDLRRSPPAHSDSTIVVENHTFNVEEYENVGAGGLEAHSWGQLDHLENVGLIHHHHHGPSHGQV
jgi:hypothetical protein